MIHLVVTWFLRLAGPVCALVILIDDIRLRRQLRIERDAAEAAMALSDDGNTITVDGYELPKPSDSRWRMDGGYLRLGVVRVSKHNVVIENETVYDMASDDAYIDQVWKTYRTRVVRQSLKGAK
jgi:hypothetical protein